MSVLDVVTEYEISSGRAGLPTDLILTNYVVAGNSFDSLAPRVMPWHPNHVLSHFLIEPACDVRMFLDQIKGSSRLVTFDAISPCTTIQPHATVVDSVLGSPVEALFSLARIMEPMPTNDR